MTGERIEDGFVDDLRSRYFPLAKLFCVLARANDSGGSGM